MKSKERNEKNKREGMKHLTLALAVMLAFIATIPGVMAHCPLCTGATIVGVGITRSLGLDDSIVGVFVG
ncbi:hypothetical protein CO038_00480, partial [Candidatus Pacearchaeota archaeon CG_4_9_14_0_2_um_filter_39_13]